MMRPSTDALIPRRYIRSDDLLLAASLWLFQALVAWLLWTTRPAGWREQRYGKQFRRQMAVLQWPFFGVLSASIALITSGFEDWCAGNVQVGCSYIWLLVLEVCSCAGAVWGLQLFEWLRKRHWFMLDVILTSPLLFIGAPQLLLLTIIDSIAGEWGLLPGPDLVLRAPRVFVWQLLLNSIELPIILGALVFFVVTSRVKLATCKMAVGDDEDGDKVFLAT